jgi:hypothetical protein
LEIFQPFMERRSEYYDVFTEIDPKFCSTNEFINLNNIEIITSESERNDMMEENVLKEFNFIIKSFFITNSLLRLAFNELDVDYFDNIKKL